MRFAVSMLSLLGIASVIGTVLQQNKPYEDYIIKFGQFWFDCFEKIGLFDVYHSIWFLVILLFLVISTSVCIYRNSPLMIKEWKTFKENATEKSLRAFEFQQNIPSAYGVETSKQRLLIFLADKGFTYTSKIQENGGELIAAKLGTHQRMGYILTHAAIVIICFGGLLDGNLSLKIQELLGHKKIETLDLPVSQIPPISRLDVNNSSFRANMTLPEGSSGNVAYVRVRDGYLVQDLPFTIGLKAFRMENYATGQPKSYESDLVIMDPALPRPIDTTISVNHPFTYKGIAIYQSDFQDGGTKLDLKVWNLLTPHAQTQALKGAIFEKSDLGAGNDVVKVEFNDFRKFNILDLSSDGTGKKHNVGPNITYKLRDIQGQAHEYVTYMNPMQIDGQYYFLSGMRESVQDDFRYLRIPADEDGALEGFMHFKATMLDSKQYPEIARKLSAASLGGGVDVKLRAQFEQSVTQLLATFANGGFTRIAQAIEKRVPPNQREAAAQTYIKMLSASAFEAYNISLSAENKPLLVVDTAAHSTKSQRLVQDSLTAMSDMSFYGSPYYLQLTDYQQKQASGLQLTKSPGQKWVYLGSALLVLGIFSMFYIRERRLWLLLNPATAEVLFAMSSNRKNLDFEQEFNLYGQQITQTLM